MTIIIQKTNFLIVNLSREKISTHSNICNDSKTDTTGYRLCC